MKHKRWSKQWWCAVITFGLHWYKYFGASGGQGVKCRLCSKLPASAWKMLRRLSGMKDGK